jgi:hypothetical protein
MSPPPLAWNPGSAPALELLSEIFNEGDINIISLLNIRPIIIYVHSSQCRLIPYLHQSLIIFKTSSSIVAISELIRGAQCLIEVIRSSGEEMWRVDAYQISYYSRGIEGEKRTHPWVTRFASYTVCTTFLSLFLHEPKQIWDQSLNESDDCITSWRLLWRNLYGIFTRPQSILQKPNVLKVF